VADSKLGNKGAEGKCAKIFTILKCIQSIGEGERLHLSPLESATAGHVW